MSKNQAVTPPPIEFTGRIARLLLSLIDGTMKLLDKEDNLQKKLNETAVVIKKGIRVSSATELDQLIDDYFDRLILEQKFAGGERDLVNAMVLEVVETIKSMMKNSGDFNSGIDECTDKIQEAETMQDILKVKNFLVLEMQKARQHSLNLYEELEKHRTASETLTKKLEESEAKAMVDALTNVLNRNAYNLKIGQLFHEFKRYKEPWALLVLDIDHFKLFNDKYGHKTGDKVLKSVAGTITDSIRLSDQVFRYGGEEFVVILSRIDKLSTSTLSEKIRKAIERDYFVDGDKKLQVTMSIGASIIGEADTETSLFERADKALYQAKENGRNQIMVDA
ncbi:MAG: GGDEF domain-containing protein [Nitrospina sp.]|jgi:diguanylate cyclase|nr:GGDEF domain-containing protein [Nitrospina sp.]